jgi:hypothetical protein
MALLHELHHCSNENMNLPGGYEAEANATWRAIEALAKDKRDPSLIDAFKRETAVQIGGDYDYSLYIDAMQHGRTAPTAAAIAEATAEVEPLFAPLITKKVNIALDLCAQPDKKAACAFNPPAFKTALAAERYRYLDEAISGILDVKPKAKPVQEKGPKA